MSVELIPLKQGQHVVTYVPKVTTDLPFFNLTHRKKGISNKIKFEGEDAFGNPMNWEVRHNTDDDIGYAGVLAHEVWYLVIKPAVDASHLENGKIPQIIELGGIRECLRMVGWTEGGHQAKDFIKALRQITFAGCMADLWFPTGQVDEKGKPTFKQVKGSFSRMSVYAIGEHHLTEDELKNADFEFDLEDKIYIELNRIEVALQEAQADQQKIIDNEYMFSVKPIARRWYELMAGKVFGTVHYKKAYFKFRYSEYIKHHHTLKRFYELKRVKEQMNRVVIDHIATGYLNKVEYTKIKELGKELDFEIKYFVGDEAKNSISRIRRYLATNTRKKNIKVKKAQKRLDFDSNSQTDISLPKAIENPVEAKISSDTGTGQGSLTNALSTITNKHHQLLQILTVKYKISNKKANELLQNYFDRITLQLEALPFRNAKDESAMLIRSIEQNYSLPSELLEAQESLEKKKAKEAKRAEQKDIADKKQQIIDTCDICNNEGIFYVPALFKMNTSVSIIRATHNCSHIAETEKDIEQYDEELHKEATPELIKSLEKDSD